MSIRTITCLAVAGALFACGGPTTMPQHRASPVAWSSMIYAATGSPILVEVAGQPLGHPDAAMAPQVARMMTGAVFGYPTSFTADPAQARHPNFRTVMVFSPAPALTEDAVCAGRLAFVAAPRDAVQLLGVFCNNARPLSYVTGNVAGVAGPDDPRFVGLVRAATRDLFRYPSETMRNDVFDLF